MSESTPLGHTAASDKSSQGDTSALIGAIDCGSNAIRMVIARTRGPRHIEPVTTVRAPVRLGKWVFTRGELDKKSMADAIGAFQRFRAAFDAHGVVGYRAVATSALRNAHNGDALVHRLYHEAGIELEIIDGDEEARLMRKAVLHAFIGHPPPRVILDLGGGSLEIALRLSDGAHGWHSVSLPVGTVRLLESFDLDGPIGLEEAGMVRRYTASLLGAVPFDRAFDSGVSRAGPVAACGGNPDALARLFGALDDTGMPGFELRALEDALPALSSSSVEQRMAQYGVRRDRAEVMSVAALVLTTVCRRLCIDRVTTPGVGIRDAILLDLSESLSLESHPGTLDAPGPDDTAYGKALLTAAHTFAKRVGHDLSHGEHVRKLARSVFDQLRDVHGLPGECGVILEIAALLHDVGEVVNARNHHKHSEYLIRNGRIPGLVEPYREMVAVLARCHRKSPPDSAKHPGFAAMSRAQRGQIMALAAILRLADALDTQHGQLVEDIVVSRMGDTVAMDVLVESPQVKQQLDTAVLPRKAQLFEQVFGYQVTFTVGTASLSPGDTSSAPAPDDEIA